MDGDTGYSCPSPSPATSSTIMAPSVLAIRTHKNQSNVPPPGKKTPVIVHTESAQVKVEPVKKTKKEKKKTLAAPAVADRFSVQYGVNFAGLEPWIKLCRDLGVEGPLNSKTQCKKVSEDQLSFAPRHFLDAVDARASAAACYADPLARTALLSTPVQVRFFDSEWSLSAYTLANHRVYPRREVRANTEHPLRLLMAHIRCPRGGKARRGAIGC